MSKSESEPKVVNEVKAQLEKTLDRCAPRCWREWKQESDLYHHADTIKDVWNALQILKRGA